MSLAILYRIYDLKLTKEIWEFLKREDEEHESIKLGKEIRDNEDERF